jgi:hypothetical protein
VPLLTAHVSHLRRCSWATTSRESLPSDDSARACSTAACCRRCGVARLLCAAECAAASLAARVPAAPAFRR